MAGNASQHDLETISNGVLDGLRTADQLPENVRNQLYDYWGSKGIDMSNPNSDVTQAQLDALKQQRESQSGGIFNSPIFKPIEWIGSKLYQVYSSTVSPIVSAGLMAAHSVVYGRPDSMKDESDLNVFQDYWNYAHHVSPGQSVWMMGLSNKEMEDRGIDWKTITQDSNLQNKGLYHDTPTAQDPFGIKTRSQEYFGQGASKWATGTADFAVSWFADPLVLGGKAAGALKAAKVTREVAPEIAKGTAIGKGVGLSNEEANQLAWNNFSQKSPFQSLTDTIWNIKSSNPDTASAVLARDLPTLRKSANGAAVARLLGQATDQTQVANILRVSMGDTAAKTTLEFQNSKLAYQVDELNQRVASAGTYYDSLPPAVQASPRGVRIKAAIDAQSAWISKLNNDSRIIDDTIDTYRTIGSLNYNKITTPIGLRTKGAYNANSGFRPLQGEGKIIAAANNIYSLGLGGVVRLAHTYNDIRPTHYIDTNADDAWRQVDASLREAPGLSQQAREMYVTRFLNADVNDKALALQEIERDVARRSVDRYNEAKNLTGTSDALTYDVADSLYHELAQRRSAGQAAMKQQTFGGATIENPNLPGTQIRVSEIEGDGGKVVLTPVLASQLANSHVMMDFDLFDKAIKTHGSSWQKAFNTVGTGWEHAVNIADAVGSIWKFAQLFRLGYGPRALSDDALGQVARFGMFSMINRTIQGGKMTAADWANQTFLRSRYANAEASRAVTAQQIEDHISLQKSLEEEMRQATAAGDTAKVAQLNTDLETSKNWLEDARSTNSDMDKIVKGGAAMQRVQVGRQIFDPAFGGKEGSLFRDLASGDRNFRNLMGSSSDFFLDRMRRMDWENISPATHGADEHMNNWLRVINRQVANDDLAVQHLAGKTDRQLMAWLNTTPEGRAYQRIAPLKNLPQAEMIKRVTAQVDEWLNPAMPGMDAARQAARTGTVTKEMLNEVPEAARPMVNAQALNYARGNHAAAQLMDSAMTGWYKLMAEVPARKLLRNPLFAQRYKVHLKDSMRMLGEDATLTESHRMQLESAARKMALDDVKKNTFSMDHETKMSYMMRNFGAFFGAQQESWNRWARIISDKPDILPRISQVYGAPARAGITVDQNGMPIDAEGYSRDPATGEKVFHPYGDRKLMIQIPDFLGGKALKKAFGLDANAAFTIPMSSLNIVATEGDGPMPVGAGPLVQLALNDIPFTGLDANGDPKIADFYQSIGLMPYGPAQSNWDILKPSWLKKADATDEMNSTYQQSLFYMMQAETYKYDMHLRKTQPTWDELKKRADTWTKMKALFNWVLPFTFSSQDPYQFFRDQYKQMQNTDYKNADQNFYDKYGDSAFIFSQSLTKNNSGLKPTEQAVHASKYYQDLIQKTGQEWAGLIIGAEGEGQYSNGAFYYEKTHSADGMSGVTMRSGLSAKDAMDQAQLAKGWQQYNSYMNGLYAQLFQRGLKSFDDAGAEDLKQNKESLVEALSNPEILGDGGQMVKNPTYNQQWSKAYNSFDLNYYDRTAATLKQIVSDPEIWSKAVNPDGSVGMRSDIYTLKSYLAYRDDVKKALIMRNSAGGSADINAQSNQDLKQQWNSLVIKFIESDTKFGELFNRYLSRDMGFDKSTVFQEAQTGQLPGFAGDNTFQDQSQQSVFDQLGGTA